MFKFSIPRLPYREDIVVGLIGFIVFIVPLAFSIFSHENFETIKLVLFWLLLGAASFVYLNRLRQAKAQIGYNKIVYLLLGLFILLAILSTLGSIDKLFSIFGFYYRFTSGLIFYLSWALFLFLLLAINEKEKLIYLLKILVFGAMVIAVYGFFQSLGINFYIPGGAGGFARAPSLLGNPNFSMMYAAALLPFALAFMAESKSFASKIYYAVGIFFIIFTNAIFSSRGALLAIASGLLVGLSVLIFFHFPKKLIWKFLAVIFLAGIFSFGLVSVSRPQAVSSVVQSADDNTFFRLEAWTTSINGIRTRPFLGTGPGTFALFYERSRTQGLGSIAGVFDDAHNLFLQMAVTAGLPFVLTFISLLILAVVYGLKELVEKPDLQTAAAISALAAWIFGVCFNPVPIPMFLLLAVILAFLFYPKLTKINRPKTLWLFAPIYALAGVLIVCGTVLLVAEQIFYFAEMGYINFNYKETYKLSRLAYKVNPTNQITYLYELASAIRIGKDSGEIVQGIENLKKIHPNYTTNYVEAGNLYAMLYERTKEKQYLQHSVENMEQALKIDPNYSERYGQLALYNFQLGNLPAAKAAIQKSLALKQTDFYGWLFMAKVYQLENQRSPSLAALDKAYKLRPDIVQLRYLIDALKQLPDFRQIPIQVSVQRPDIN
ncbi:MAG: O-antigen ligase family protein [Candidatus Doudnabacteria bacterium]|nr:O-antigen ligase family protein [Candidatus Doudnabacteria bacterium]